MNTFFIRKLFPEIASFNKSDAKSAMDTAWRNAFEKNKVARGLMLPCSIVAGFFIYILVAILLPLELISKMYWPFNIIGLMLAPVTAIIIYELWQAYLIAKELKKSRMLGKS